jgi:hypothetical protein
MSDESAGDSRGWSASGRGSDLVDQDVLTALAGRIDRTRPIGPLGLRLRSRRPYVLATVAVAALLGGAGAALVITGSPRPVPASNAAAPGPAPSSSSGSSPANIGSALPGMVHGQFIQRAAGGYQTVDVQSGQVTAVSSSSITLRSTDGFTRSYTVVVGTTMVDAGRDGISSVRVGDQASVEATVSGNQAMATRIDDQTVLRERGANA